MAPAARSPAARCAPRPACSCSPAGSNASLAPSARIGVHQITTLVSETEGLAHLKSTRKIYEQKGVDAAVEAYLDAMGVGDPVMTLMRKTWAASIRWLSPAELKASRLATLALDPAEPVLASGANGLNGQSARRRSAARRSHSRRASRNRSPEATRRSKSPSAIAAAAAWSKRRRTSAVLSRRRRHCLWP